MATYPATLPLPTLDYSRRQQTGVRQGNLSAKPRQQRVSYDNQVTYDLVFAFTQGQARLFRQWIVEELANGRKWFTITLKEPSGLTTKTVRFTAGGRPQATPQQNVLWRYTAQVISRS